MAAAHAAARSEIRRRNEIQGRKREGKEKEWGESESEACM